MNSFYSQHELWQLNFRCIGEDVLISRKASLYGTENMIIGNHVRIDDFCILSGEVTFGDYIHVAAYTAIYGSDVGVDISNYANISSKVVIYAVSDDYSGGSMTNPMVPDEYKVLERGKVKIGCHVIVGTGSTILPGVNIQEGTSIGAMSLVKEDTEAWVIYAGIPVKKIKTRRKDLLELEKELRKNS